MNTVWLSFSVSLSLMHVTSWCSIWIFVCWLWGPWAVCSNHGILTYEVNNANRNILGNEPTLPELLAPDPWCCAWHAHAYLWLSAMPVHTQLGTGFVPLNVISQAYRGVSFDNHVLRTLKLRSRPQPLRRAAFTGVGSLWPFPGVCKATPVVMRSQDLPLSLCGHLPLGCKGVVTQPSSCPQARQWCPPGSHPVLHHAHPSDLRMTLMKHVRARLVPSQPCAHLSTLWWVQSSQRAICTPEHSTFKENCTVVWVASWTNHFSQNIIFTGKNKRQTNCGC